MDYTEQLNNISENIRCDIEVIAQYKISSVFIDGEEKINNIFQEIANNILVNHQRLNGYKVKSVYGKL